MSYWRLKMKATPKGELSLINSNELTLSEATHRERQAMHSAMLSWLTKKGAWLGRAPNE